MTRERLNIESDNFKRKLKSQWVWVCFLGVSVGWCVGWCVGVYGVNYLVVKWMKLF